MIELNHVSFEYASGKGKTGLYDIHLNIKKGETVLFCGPSGSGKTTVTRLINGLIPHYYEGEIEGSVCIDGEDILQKPLYEVSERVGSVFQNPRSQFFNVDTTGELAFGCENKGLCPEEIRGRIKKSVSDFRIEHLMHRSIFKLSGGEKQKLACAAVHACHPDIFVLDEPSSNLDAKGIEDIRKVLSLLKSQGKTVIISEHRLYFLRDLADRMIYLEEGRIQKEFSMAQMKEAAPQHIESLGLRPFYLESLSKKEQPEIGRTYLQGQNFYFSYGKKTPLLAVEAADFPKNLVTGIVGENGAGKSTLARCICGLEKKSKGYIKEGEHIYGAKQLLKRCYMVMQDVNHQLFTESVMDEVLLSMEQEEEQRAEDILKSLDILSVKEAHPMSLSGGQKQRVAIAGAIASGKDIIIFDEPTSGLDLKHMKEVAHNIRRLKEMNKTVLLISHDLEFLLRCTDFILHLEKGHIKARYVLDEKGQEMLKTWFLSQGNQKE